MSVTTVILLFILMVSVGINVTALRKNSFLKRQLTALNKDAIAVEKNIKTSCIDEISHRRDDLTTTEQIERTIELIRNFMYSEKPYLDAQFNMNRLCEALDINRTYLSRAINQGTGARFETFINSFRITDAIDLLCSDTNSRYTLEFLAGEVGFQSKSTFNRSFKFFTDVNPSFFQKRIIDDRAAFKFFMAEFRKRRSEIVKGVWRDHN